MHANYEARRLDKTPAFGLTKDTCLWSCLRDTRWLRCEFGVKRILVLVV